MKKRAQAWGFDLMVASSIFIAGILIFYIYTINLSEESETILSKMQYEAGKISDSLLSKGTPNNWNSENVQRIGISDDRGINQTKLDLFYDFVSTPTGYERTKAIFDTSYDYYITMNENIIITGIGTIEGGIGLSPPAEPKNLIKLTRVSIYNNKTVSLGIEIWEE